MSNSKGFANALVAVSFLGICGMSSAKQFTESSPTLKQSLTRPSGEVVALCQKELLVRESDRWSTVTLVYLEWRTKGVNRRVWERPIAGGRDAFAFMSKPEEFVFANAGDEVTSSILIGYQLVRTIRISEIDRRKPVAIPYEDKLRQDEDETTKPQRALDLSLSNRSQIPLEKFLATDELGYGGRTLPPKAARAYRTAEGWILEVWTPKRTARFFLADDAKEWVLKEYWYLWNRIRRRLRRPQ